MVARNTFTQFQYYLSRMGGVCCLLISVCLSAGVSAYSDLPSYQFAQVDDVTANSEPGNEGDGQQEGEESGESGGDLAKELANPISSLVSLPIQSNYDKGFGIDKDGSAWRTNVQPVVPISIGKDWNLISRTILPIIQQSDIPSKGLGEDGIGDILQSFFFSPKEPTANGIIWGVGPAMLFDSASSDALGTGRNSLGPTLVMLTQNGGWTVGALANHLVSVTGSDDRAKVNSTFLQPFVSYVTQTQTTWGLNLESTYDWEADQGLVPMNLTVAQLMSWGSQMVQVGGGVRYWLESPKGAAQDWGVRLQFTLLFPSS